MILTLIPLLVSALAMGLLGSTHCVLMCGGVASVLSAGLVPLGRKPMRVASLTLAYNAGRIASYAAAGALAGAFGAAADHVEVVHGTRIGLRIVAGLFMIGVGAYLTGAWRRFGRIEEIGAPLWRRVEPIAKRLLPVRSAGAAILLGSLWGWMPCGLVYSALGIALGTGSIAGGAAAMTAFGLGTLPAMLAMGAVAARVKGFIRRARVRRAAGIAIALFGAMNVATASAQAGWTKPETAVHSCCAKHAREKAQ
jgi:sulfite exporter TauE/SafE